MVKRRVDGIQAMRFRPESNDSHGGSPIATRRPRQQTRHWASKSCKTAVAQRFGRCESAAHWPGRGQNQGHGAAITKVWLGTRWCYGGRKKGPPISPPPLFPSVPAVRGSLISYR